MNESKNDELIGQWHTDNSGGIHVLYGSAIKFDKDGKGLFNSWGGSDDPEDKVDPKYEYEFSIEWVRIDASTIRVKQENSTEWILLNYEMSTSLGEYSAIYDKLISIGNNPTSEIIKEWFWNIPEPLYRRR